MNASVSSMSQRSSHGLRVGVDVGGTFTDVCLFDDASRQFVTVKVASDPRDQAGAVIDGVQRALGAIDAGPGAVDFLGHGTTVGLNALLERKGARIAFVTTEGFRDVLELARQQREHLYDFFAERPQPLAPRALRLEVRERTRSDGTVEVAVTPRALAPVIRALRTAKVDAVAVGFLNAYRNPENEQRAKALIERALPGIPVTCSAEASAEFREFERFSSTALNAYLIPRMARYLTGLAARAREASVGSAPLIFQSNGAVVGLAEAVRIPIRTLMSGPAAGVLGAAFVAGAAGFPDVITFDMGGTSTDVAIIESGVPSVTSGRKMAGYPILSPTFDVQSIGAGGGSIGWVDAGGFVKVGPQSAGAEPGPACYGRGGAEATVTDADLVLGYLSPAGLLGGAMSLHPDRAREALDRLGARAGLPLCEAAAGVVRIVTANIARLVRLMAFERGRVPAEFALVAFGGAGPLHAGLVARELGIDRIVVPAYPGLLCSLGMLVADLRADFSQTFLVDLDDAHLTDAVAAEVGALAARLERTGRAAIADALATFASAQAPYVHAALELRYKGQNYEIAVPLRPGRDLGDDPRKALLEAVEDFHALHARVYGYAPRDAVVQLVTLRLGVGVEQDRHGLDQAPSGARHAGHAGEREIRLVDRPEVPVRCAVLAREALGPGDRVEGPAIVEQMDTTVLVLPGQAGVTDRAGNLVITEVRA
jgi:N-methylhydantoinase A